MQLTIGKKLGVIVVCSTILILVSTFVTWQYNKQIKAHADKSMNESIVFALKAKEM
jgi:hypothetical protein